MSISQLFVGLVTFMILGFRSEGSQASCTDYFGSGPISSAVASDLVIENGVTLERRSSQTLYLHSEKYALSRHFDLREYGPLQGMDLSPQGERMVLFFAYQVVIYDIVDDKTVYSQIIPEAFHHRFRPNNTFILWNDDHQFVVERIGMKNFLLTFWEEQTMVHTAYTEFSLGRVEQSTSHRHWSKSTLWGGHIFLESLQSYFFLKERGFYFAVHKLFKDPLYVQVAAPPDSRSIMISTRRRRKL